MALQDLQYIGERLKPRYWQLWPCDIHNYTGSACLITEGYEYLFICFVTKAINLEAVTNLSKSAFLAALARFHFLSRIRYGYIFRQQDQFIGESKNLKGEFRGFLEELGSWINYTYGSRMLI